MEHPDLPQSQFVQDLPKDVLLPFAVGYHSVIATQVCLSVALAWVTGSAIVTLVLWLLLAKPIGVAVGACVTMHWQASSAVFAAATIEGFLCDWRIGTAAMLVLAALLVLAVTTVAEWRQQEARPSSSC